MSWLPFLVGVVLLAVVEIHTRTREMGGCYPDPQFLLQSTHQSLVMAMLAERSDSCPLVMPRKYLEDYGRTDEYGTQLLILCSNGVTVVSAGPDQLFGTFDDRGIGRAWCSWPIPEGWNDATDRTRSSCRRRYSPW